LARLPIALVQAIHISQQMHLIAIRIRQPVSEVVNEKMLYEKS
jgi:hypothetical protein